MDAAARARLFGRINDTAAHVQGVQTRILWTLRAQLRVRAGRLDAATAAGLRTVLVGWSERLADNDS